MWCLVVLFMTPVVLGIAGTVLPSLGLLPGLSTGQGYTAIFQDPRLTSALLLSIQTGVLATVLVLALTLLSLVCTHDTRLCKWLSVSLPPVLAVPHAAIAVGLLCLISPSGAVVRLPSPELTGWTRPPTSWVVPDAQGWSLIIGLVINMSVGDNLHFGLREGTRQSRELRVSRAFEDAGLPGVEQRDPATLSGGQRARISFIRTLLSDPCAWLLDELFSGLDTALREQIRLFTWASASRLPVLLVTHDRADIPRGAKIITIGESRPAGCSPQPPSL